MATRFKVQPPTRPDGNETVKYTCLECNKEHIEDPFAHARLYRHDRHIVVDTRFAAYYNKEHDGTRD